MSFDAGMIPDWVRTLAVLRRNPRQWPATSILRSLANLGHAEGEELDGRVTWRATEIGLKALAAWEAINGASEDPVRFQKRPGTTIGMVTAWAVSIASLEECTPEQRAAMEAICSGCDMVRTDAKGNWCSVCGCGTSAYDRAIFNLCSRVEAKDIRLCKHPERPKKGWPLPQFPVEAR